MLSAIELFHYSYKFKDKVVVINFSKTNMISEMLSDLRVLHSSHVNSLVLLHDNGTVRELLDRANLKGHRFVFQAAGENTDNWVKFCETCWAAGQIPVLASSIEPTNLAYLKWSFNVASNLKAAKYYYLQERDGIFGGGKFISYSTSQDILASLKKSKFNLDTQILSELCTFQTQAGIDVGIVAAKRGSLFQELFTHRGSGTLISGNYPNVIRQATTSDISEIQFLLLPYIRSGAMLPISDETLLDEIDSFYVFTVNNAIVASARIVNFGAGCEIAKFCTLPRYQRKGRARKLLLELMQVAEQMGFEYIFLLSLEPKMWSFLNSLEFSEVNYYELPAAWLKKYDTSRGSKAFKAILAN